MGEEYAECLKRQSHMDGKIDGCQKYFSKWQGGLNCDICSCHRNYHRRVVRYATEVVYTECHKMHHDGSGSVGYKDGCKEYVGSGVYSSRCAACECHKSFHRNEIIKEVAIRVERESA